MDAIQRALFERTAGFSVDALRHGIRFLAVFLLLIIAAYIVMGIIQQLKATDGYVDIREMSGRVMRLSLIVALGMTVVLS